MKVLFLCGIYPQNDIDKIFKNSKRGYQFAAQNFQEAVISGFIQNKVNLEIITVPFLSAFPFGYKKPFVNYGTSKYYNVVPTKCVSFINIPFLREVSSSIENDVFKWCKCSGTNDVKHIIVYSLNVNLMKAALAAKNKYPNVKLSIIVPDLPEYVAYNHFFRLLGLREKNINYIYNNVKWFDNFILLTESMKLPLNIKSKNFCVIEGIFRERNLIDERLDFEEGVKSILYTGALSKKYGIETLLSAFNSLRDVNYRLIICGQGEAEELIENYCKIDMRISFLGKVSHEVIVSMQRGADLLVNPRTNKGEYTQYSFPSKTMEYFASGTPVLMYKLGGVPTEYFKYCFTLDIETEEALANKLNEILLLSEEERRKIGERAAEFVLNKKNAMCQVDKIIQLLNQE